MKEEIIEISYIIGGGMAGEIAVLLAHRVFAPHEDWINLASAGFVAGALIGLVMHKRRTVGR